MQKNGITVSIEVDRYGLVLRGYYDGLLGDTPNYFRYNKRYSPEFFKGINSSTDIIENLFENFVEEMKDKIAKDTIICN